MSVQDYFQNQDFSLITAQKSIQLEQGMPSGSHNRSNSVQHVDGGIRNQEPIELIKPIQSADNTTEFLMLTLQKALNYQPAQVQELLTNQNQYLMQACDLGIRGDYEQIQEWFKILIQNLQKMLQLFRIAYTKNGALEVGLVLSSIRCGFFSQDEKVCELAIEVMERISEDFYQKPIETGLQVIKNKKKSGASITEIKIPVFRQFQDWFVRSTKPPKIVSQNRYLKANQQSQTPAQIGDPSSILRIVCTEILDNHQHLAVDVARLILNIFRVPTVEPSPFNLAYLPELLAEVLADDVYMCYQALSILLPIMREFDRGSLQKILVESNLILRLLALANETNPDPAMRLIATTLLFDLWHMEPIIVCNPRDGIAVKDTLNEVILSGILHQDKVYRLTLYGCAFSVLTHLIDLKSQEAPVLLKTVITGFVTHMQGPNRKDRITEEFVLRNLADLFEQRPDIPIAVLLEPLVEILGERLKGERAQGGTQLKHGTITTEQLYFLIRVSRHPKITSHSALLLLELLSTIYMGKPLLATTILRSITDLVHRFYDKSKQIRNFTDSIMIAKALSTTLTYKKEESIGRPSFQRPLAITAAAGQNQSESRLQNLPRNIKVENKKISADVTKKITKYNMVILVECLYSLNNNQVQLVVTDQLRILTERYYTAFRTTSSSYEYLISKLNLEIISPELEQLPSSNQTPGSNSNQSRDYLQQRAMSVEHLGRKVRDMEQSRLENKSRMKQLQWSEAKEPRNDIALRAIEEMNEIKQQRMRKQNAERIEELKRKEKMEKMIEGASADVAMRNLILEKETAKRKEKVKDILAGKFSTQPSTAADSTSEQHSSINVFDPFHANILNCMQRQDKTAKIDEREMKIVLNLSQFGREGITLINFEFEEEERERDAMKLVVFKNQNLFKYLFCKYTSMGQLNKRKGSIELTPTGDRLITMVELQRFFKDQGIESTLISQKELTTLVKMINDCMLLRHGQSAMDYSGFVQLIIQTSILIYRRGRVKEISPKQALMIQCADLVSLIIKRFQDHAVKRGELQLLYQAPQAMSSTSGLIDEKVANQINILNSSLKPEIGKLGFQVSQSKVIKQVASRTIPSSARIMIGESRCDVIEILNDIFEQSLGISLLESLVGQKDGVEFSILPAYSGYNGSQTDVRASQQSIKSNKTESLSKAAEKDKAQKDIPVKGKGKAETKQAPALIEQPVKGKDNKDAKGKLPPQKTAAPTIQKNPPNYPIYAIDLLVKKLRNQSEAKRVARLDLENEQILMGINWTPQLKVACFELQQIRPCSQLNDMREIAQLVEDMLVSTTQGQKYKTAAERERKFKAASIPKFSEPVQIKPQLDLITKKKREESLKIKKEAEIELKQQRDLEFMKRGLMLKEQVKLLKEVKEEKIIIEKLQKIELSEAEKEKQAQLSERLRRVDEQRNLEMSENKELKSFKQKQEQLQQEVKNSLGAARQKLANITNLVFFECRERFCHEHGETEDSNQQIQAHDVMALYLADQTQEAFLEAEPEIKKHFDQVLAQQNVTSRPIGAPQHRGLNLDGVINFCIRADLLPQLVQVDDVIHACKLQLRDRDHLNLKFLDRSQIQHIHPRMQSAYPTSLQSINFENRGGHFDYKEFCLILVRLFVLTNQRGTMDSYQNNDQDVIENELYQEAVALNFHGQLHGEITKIIQCQTQTLALNNLIQELSQLSGYLELFKKEGKKAPIKPMKLDIDRISFQELKTITQFVQQRLFQYKLIKLPLQAASYSSNETPYKRKASLGNLSSLKSLKAPLVSIVELTAKKQRNNSIHQPTTQIGNTEPRRVPLKSQGLKQTAQAVNMKDQRQSALNKDLPKLSIGEVADHQVETIKILGEEKRDEVQEQLEKQSPFNGKQRLDFNQQNLDSYRDVLENSEDMFQDYSMNLISPKKKED